MSRDLLADRTFAAGLISGLVLVLGLLAILLWRARERERIDHERFIDAMYSYRLPRERGA